MQMVPEITTIPFCQKLPWVSAQSFDKYVHCIF